MLDWYSDTLLPLDMALRTTGEYRRHAERRYEEKCMVRRPVSEYRYNAPREDLDMSPTPSTGALSVGRSTPTPPPPSPNTEESKSNLPVIHGR